MAGGTDGLETGTSLDGVGSDGPTTFLGISGIGFELGVSGAGAAASAATAAPLFDGSALGV
jgi:hypothetical protein